MSQRQVVVGGRGGGLMDKSDDEGQQEKRTGQWRPRTCGQQLRVER